MIKKEQKRISGYDRDIINYINKTRRSLINKNNDNSLIKHRISLTPS